MRNGRYFTDFTETTLEEFWKAEVSLEVFDLWNTRDVRPGREEEKWINLMARRVQKPTPRTATPDIRSFMNAAG